MGNRSYQLTSAGRSAHGWLIGRHWLAGNSYFPCGRIFIFCFSEPLGINIEVLNSLLLWKGLFIQIYFDGLCFLIQQQRKKVKNLLSKDYFIEFHFFRHYKDQSFKIVIPPKFTEMYHGTLGYKVNHNFHSQVRLTLTDTARYVLLVSLAIKTYKNLIVY